MTSREFQFDHMKFLWGDGTPTQKRKPVPTSLKRQLYMKCNGKCMKCKKKKFPPVIPQIHHKNRKPSDNRLANLMVVCPDCHSIIHTDDKKKTKPKKTKPKKTKQPKSFNQILDDYAWNN